MGNFYDSMGRFLGRTEGNSHYDAMGRYLGRSDDWGAMPLCLYY